MKFLIVFMTAGCLFLLSCSKPLVFQSYDLLITNALIIDGTGTPAYAGSILVNNGLIQQFGDIDTTRVRASQKIDAAGRVVTPGFIDTHSHGDPMETPRFNNFLAMGVTTISLGMDGSNPGTNDIANWMNIVERTGTGPNILHFTGHNTLRELVEAPRESGLDSVYIEQMKSLLTDALHTGSFGLTTGLEYDHGTFSDLDELVQLAKPVAEAGGLVMSHLRSEDDDKIENAIRELINQGRLSGAGVHISHLKIVHGNERRRAESVLNLMQEARHEGVRITADLYPYTASYTGLSILFPDWALPPNDYQEAAQNRSNELFSYVRSRVNARNGPEATLFGTGLWAGFTLAEVEEYLERPFENILIQDFGPGGASAAYFVINEQAMRLFLTDPFVMISSDGSPTMHHPRGYGSFAKVIRKFVMEEELLSLEEAIFKMTGLPAGTLGISDPDIAGTARGLIREGFAADILIFDPENVTDQATYEEPHLYATGFDWVFVNGTAVISGSEKNNRKPGIVIRRSIQDYFENEN
jgi:N-acyl-D-amino-acid deacylase